MKYLFLGNPGTGKSTLLNALLGKVEFPSGVEYGSGMTNEFKSVKDTSTQNTWYVDTPGLDDIKIREQAAAEITQALKMGDDYYKLIFVVTEQDGRVLPSDVTTMECVLNALADTVETMVPYGVIVNKITKKKINTLMTDPTKMNKFKASINREYVTSFFHLYERKSELEDEKNKLHEPTADLWKWFADLPPIRIESDHVKDVDVRDYDGLNKQVMQLQAEMKRNDAIAEERVQIMQAEHNRQVQEILNGIDGVVTQREDDVKQSLKEFKGMHQSSMEDVEKLQNELETLQREKETIQNKTTWAEVAQTLIPEVTPVIVRLLSEYVATPPIFRNRHYDDYSRIRISDHNEIRAALRNTAIEDDETSLE